MTYTSMSLAHVDSGGLDYITRPPVAFQTTGAIAASVADVNDDGYLDAAFACYASNSFEFETQSMVFLGSPVGWRDLPHWTYNTTGARDVLLEDLNGDGHVDIVFAQEKDGTTYDVDSLLFWGSSSGWDDEPDVRFDTNGASGVVADDLDGDGHMDLAFACYSNGLTRAIDSMVFIQDEGSFNGTSPDYGLATKGARAVASGDLDDDGRVDLVFANFRSTSSYETDSYVYLGQEWGGFSTTPIELPTKGAQDVQVDDLDGDGHRDIVFAGLMDNGGDHSVGSPVFLNDGAGGFPDNPSHILDTMGAMAVEVADLDGIGWKDLIFACHSNGTSYEQTSVGYLGGISGWSSVPDITIPTVGASDVVAAYLFDPGLCGYMSQTITPLDTEGTGSFHTFSYTARIGGGITGTFHIYDAVTWERLASVPIRDGDHEWDLRGEFYFKDHTHVRIVAGLDGMDGPGVFQLDDLSLNWTRRVKAPPRVVDLSLSATSEYRTGTVTLWVNVTDEYDPPGEMVLSIEHRMSDRIEWKGGMIGPMEFVDGVWTAEMYLDGDAHLGTYHFRARVSDGDQMISDWLEPPVTLEVLNNLPTSPEISIDPMSPLTSDTVTVTITRSARDVEDSGLAYRFYWYRNGVLMSTLNSDHITPEFTLRGDNWTVEVRAFDGDDEGPGAKAWVIIGNTPPSMTDQLPDLTFQEDGEAQTFELRPGFSDVDGDILSYGMDGTSENLTVEVDGATGRVTIVPTADWYGEEKLTFWASDGEMSARQVLTVNVTPVNDPPRLVEVNGKPVPSGVMVLVALHGHTLVITYSYNDVEGDMVMMAVDNDMVTLDDFLREIRFTPDDDMVGTVTFTLTIWDLASPDDKQTLEFQIVVENVNDPPGVPTITMPPDGSRFQVNETFALAGTCDDPDIKFGQVLTFTWTSNISGTLGTGTGVDLSLTDVGTHLITLTVSDGEFQTSATITIVIEPLESIVPPPQPPTPPGGEDEDLGLWIPIIAILVIVGVALAAASVTEPGKYRWGLMLAPMIIKKDDVLDNKTRYALHGIIVERPGIHYSAIKEEFGLSNGVAAYHLDVLEREEFIRTVRDGRLKRFYSYDTKAPKSPKMTPDETREAIMELVREQPGISQQRIINELGIERPSAGYFLRELVKEGQLKAEKEGLYMVYRVK
jgi:predicted transcriptional regulator